ncbi:MAG: hypothetical protein J2P46_08700 [Zavarzinella sp.]|nr:hypothetical protein [Zavarzinella sp.]
MTNAYVLTGTLTDKQTVRLDEAVSGPMGKVRVIIEPAAVPTADFLQVVDTIWAQQRARGHTAPTPEEVLAYVQAERDSWGDSE